MEPLMTNTCLFTLSRHLLYQERYIEGIKPLQLETFRLSQSYWPLGQMLATFVGKVTSTFTEKRSNTLSKVVLQDSPSLNPLYEFIISFYDRSTVNDTPKSCSVLTDLVLLSQLWCGERKKNSCLTVHFQTLFFHQGTQSGLVTRQTCSLQP